jgi:hypothetical protein
MGDLGKSAKAVVRAILAICAGALLAYEYYYYSPSPSDVIGTAIAMGFVAAIVVFFLLHRLGKSGD